MLDQLLDIVKQNGQETVVNNPAIPNNVNNDVLADATHTIASGLQNVLAGGGFQNILDLFKTGATTSGANSSLMSNPIVSMMVGYFTKNLIGKYNIAPNAASSVASSLIPNALQGLIHQTNDPSNQNLNLDSLVNSLTGGASQASSGGTGILQNLLQNFIGGGNSTGGLNIQNIIGSLSGATHQNMQQQSGGAGGLMNIIKGFLG